MAVIENIIQDGELIEEYGEYVSGRRKMIVTEVAGEDVEEMLLSALDESPVPQPGDSWSDNIPRLCVYKRVPRIVGKGKVEVLLDYQLEPPDKGYPLRGSTNTAQILTHKNKNGSEITVSYNGTTYKAEASVFAPEETEVRETVEETDHPGKLKNDWRNRVNADVWMGDPAGMWLITRIEYELLNAQTKPHRYRFTWEIQKSANPDGWKYYVVYRRNDGTIPDDAVWTEVVWHDQKTFSEKFPWQEAVT